MGEKIVVGVAGMPGAGKDVVREVARALGLPVVVMGDVVREEAERRGLRPTPGNLGSLMLRLREEEGPAAVARRCVPMIRGAGGAVVVDGVRSPEEVGEFRGCFPGFTVVAVHSSPETRFRRLSQRGRSDDPRGRRAFAERDRRELGVGLGEVIATADRVIVNEGTLEEFRGRAREVLEELTAG